MANAERVETKMGFLPFFLFLFKIYREQIIKLDLYLLGAVAYGIGSPVAFRYLINDAIGTKSNVHVIFWLVGLFLGYVIATYCLIRNRRLSSQVSATLIDRIRQRFYDSVQQHVDTRRHSTTSQLIAQTTVRLSSLEDFLSHKASIIIYNGLLLFFGFLVLVYINWLLSLLSFICLLGLFALSNREQSASEKLNRERETLEADFISTVRETIKKQDEIKHLNIEQTYHNKVEDLIKRLHTIAENQSFKTELSVLFLHAGAQFLILFVFMMGCLLLLFHWINIGDLVGFVLMFFPFSEALSELSVNLPVMINTTESIETLKGFIFEEVQPKSDSLVHISAFKEALEVRHAKLRADAPIFNLTLKKGGIFGIPNLSPSLVAHLVHAFSEQTPLEIGEVCLDDQLITEIDSIDYYEQVAVLGVTPCLFEGSLYYNLCLGKTVEPLVLDSVIKRLNLPPLIDSLPDGLNTLLPNEDLKLTTEQLMLIMIARMMLREPAIIILDQTLSAFDMVMSVTIKQILLDFCQVARRTLLVVSNDLKPIFDLPQLILVEDDAKVQLGTHEDFLNKNAFYRLFWSLQQALQVAPGSRTMAIDPAYLRSIYLFRLIEDDGLLKEIAGHLTLKRCQADQVLFKEGSHADEAYIIAYGLVSIERQLAPIETQTVFTEAEKAPLGTILSEEAQMQQIARLGIGDIFGEIALLNDIPRTADARTLTPCYLLVLNFQTFMDFYNKSPDSVREAINMLVTERLTSLYRTST